MNRFGFTLTPVESGASLLDEKVPGWWRDVNPGNLMMAVAELCVLGQIFGLYEIGVHVLGLDFNEASNHYGFNAPTDIFFASSAYETLTEEWREQIFQRRLVDAAFNTVDHLFSPRTLVIV